MSDSSSAAPKPSRPKYASPAIKSDADQQVWLGNPHLDNLMSMVIALSGEVWAGKQRMAILEKVLAAKGVKVADAVENYVPSKAEYEAWEAERRAMAARVFKVAVASPAVVPKAKS
jgi:hypothetical protein